MKFLALCFCEIVLQLDADTDLFEAGGKDGVFTEVYLGFVDLQNLVGVQDRESVLVCCLCTWHLHYLFTHQLHPTFLTFLNQNKMSNTMDLNRQKLEE